ncbi:MAG: DUF1934 domain-containing protein [Bacilli bacterium]|nr:DUF1934 domain-containing protein [Bacilli bacterium]
MEQKRIEIELRTVIDRNGDKEMTIVKQSGDYMRKNEIEIITFIENREDIGKIRNYITIQKHKVTIRRSGAISMSHHFEVGKKSESLYRHPYGALHFLITTKSLDCTPLSKDGHGDVVIVYDAVINGIEQQEHHLTLTYMEEKER